MLQIVCRTEYLLYLMEAEYDRQLLAFSGTPNAGQEHLLLQDLLKEKTERAKMHVVSTFSQDLLFLHEMDQIPTDIVAITEVR